jgi:hypothetical protein
VASAFISLITGGSTLASGTVVNMAVTAVYGGVETAPSRTATTTTTSANQSVQLPWGRVPGASGYNVYASTGAGAPLVKVASNVTTTFYTWNGAAGSGAIPSTTGFAEATTTPGLFAVPAGKTGTVQQVVASNPTDDWGKLYLSVVPSGQTSNGQRVISGVMIPPDSVNGGPTRVQLLSALAAGDFLTGSSTLPGVFLTVDGLLG